MLKRTRQGVQGAGAPVIPVGRRPASSDTAPAAVALALFAVAWGLHRGLDALRDLTNPTALQFKLWAVGTLLVSVLVPLVLALSRLGLDPKRALLFAEPSWKRTAVAIPVGMVAAFAFNNLWPSLIAPSSQYLEKTRNFISRETAVEYVLVFLLTVVAAPVCDELLLRGFMLGSLADRLGPATAALATAAATAVFHDWDPFKLGHAFAMGLIFAAVVLWTRNVFASVILHALLNAPVLLPGSK